VVSSEFKKLQERLERISIWESPLSVICRRGAVGRRLLKVEKDLDTLLGKWKVGLYLTDGWMTFDQSL
jgi:IS1 family transposase